MIGVIAGAGPFAGLDLLQKITAQTVAQSDQDHLTVLSISEPSAIPDRTAFLIGEIKQNPAGAIVEQLRRLEKLGASVAGIPCNTAHAPPIMDVVEQEVASAGGRLRLVHMINEVGGLLRRHYPAVQRVGVLSTIGTARAGVYPLALEPQGFEVIGPDKDVLEGMVHPAIYDSAYGLKSRGFATPRARKESLYAVENLRQKGAQAVILGCTELPLILTEKEVDGLPLIDSTLALARALIAAVEPAKLRPYTR